MPIYALVRMFVLRMFAQCASKVPTCWQIHHVLANSPHASKVAELTCQSSKPTCMTKHLADFQLRARAHSKRQFPTVLFSLHWFDFDLWRDVYCSPVTAVTAWQQ